MLSTFDTLGMLLPWVSHPMDPGLQKHHRRPGR